METLNLLLDGFGIALTLDNFILALIGCVLGTIFGAMYGGRISSILLNIPGDEPALMTTLDGYPMTQKGRAGEALTLTGLASFFGAMFATVGLVLLALQLVKVAFYLDQQNILHFLLWHLPHWAVLPLTIKPKLF